MKLSIANLRTWQLNKSTHPIKILKMKKIAFYFVTVILLGCSEGPNRVRGTLELQTMFFDESVNNAYVLWSEENLTLQLFSAGGVNSPGAFQGGGIGNKAIAGNKFFHDTLLVDFSVSWEKNNNNLVYLNLLLDTNNDSLADKVLVYDTYVGQLLSFDNTKSFKIVCLPNCTDWHNTYYNVNDFPGAKIVNSTITDGGMPVQAATNSMPGVLIILGDSSTTAVLDSTLSNFILQ